jgi:hypothetical protein
VTHPAPLARYLSEHTLRIASLESAGECFSDISDAIISIENAINRPVPPRFLGPCPTPVDSSHDKNCKNSHPHICNTELTAARADSHVQCPSCKTTHRVGELHEQQMRNTDVMSFTLSQLYRMILPINREYVPLRTLQHWVARGRLVPTGYDADGEPRFLLADVRELRDRKPQKVATGSAAHKNKRAS